ncbi:MAG: ImmA/IrrE family metallo-endopeptidase [Phycisphaeraceae bacterium]
MRRWPAIQRHKVPFLHQKSIEGHAQLLLDEWAEAHPPITEPPVPIEDMLELHLGLEFMLADLQGEYGSPDVLGAIWFGDRMVKVDQSLEPTNAPKMLGRYRFTIAHEVGHWRLHRQHLMEDPSAEFLFQEKCEPAFVCRSNANPPEEIQANAFAACVLMPRRLMFDAWAQWRGSEDPVAISELSMNDHQISEEAAMDKFCRPLAEQFEVSAQAMRYRLQKLELLVKKIEPRLF